MPKQSWYRVTKMPENEFQVKKFDEDFNLVDEYTIDVTAIGNMSCNCPAWKSECRHIQMVSIFKRHKRLGTGYFYDYDKKKWQKPFYQNA